MKVQRLLFFVSMSVGLFSCGSSNNNNNGDWVTQSVFSGQNRIGSVAFTLTVGSTQEGFVGTGFDGINYYNDFWMYDQVNNAWTQIDSIPGPPRSLGVAFATDNNGYTGLGWNGTGLTVNGVQTYYLNDFYQYNPSTGWKQIANMPTPNNAGRKYATAFGIGGVNIGGVVGGFDGQFVYKDYYEWNEGTNAWSVLNTYPGPKRQGAVSFVHDGKAYIVTGTGDNGLALTDFWRYNPSKTGAKWDDSLRRISGVTDQSYDAGYRILRSSAVAFTMNNNGIPKAYVTMGSYAGNLSDCWEYDFATDLWTEKNKFPGIARVGAVALTINGRGFIGLGGSSVAAGSGGQYFSDWTQFFPNLPFNQDDYYQQ
jgi:N-acetylneuraminic acid mutarotase